MNTPKKISILVNPFSGTGRGAQLYEKLKKAVNADAGLRDRVIHIELTRPKDEPGPYEKIFTESDAVLIVGGDGTVQQVVNLVKEHSFKGHIGVYPIGTGNDLVRTVGCRESDVVRYVRKIIERPETVKMDVFSLNGGLYFTNCVSFGGDAWVVSGYEKICNRLNGSLVYRIPYIKYLLYWIPGMWAIFFYRQKVREVGSGKSNMIIAINNMKTYAGGSVWDDNSSINDGKIELAYFPSKLDYLKLIFNRTKLYRPTHATRTMDMPFVLRFTSDVPVEIAGEDFSGQFKGCREFRFAYEGTLDICI